MFQFTQQNINSFQLLETPTSIFLRVNKRLELLFEPPEIKFANQGVTMNIADELSIPGRIETVYANLIDPEVLKRCIPGCQELEKTSDTDYAAKVILKIGPVKAKFSGNVTLDLSAAPGSLSLAGAGDGGLAGFAKGGADVELIDEGNETTLRYKARAETGGKIAQLGARLIESTAKKLSKSFFSNFEKIMLNEK